MRYEKNNLDKTSTIVREVTPSYVYLTASYLCTMCNRTCTYMIVPMYSVEVRKYAVHNGMKRNEEKRRSSYSNSPPRSKATLHDMK